MTWTFIVKSGDIYYTNSGAPAQTQSSNQKVSQDVAEATISPINAIGFGFGISTLEGVAGDPQSMPSIIENLIIEGVNRFIALQQQNQRLARDNSELIAALVFAQAAYAAPNDYTDFAFSFALNSVAGQGLFKTGSVTPLN
jgi:hypothetical protein